MTTAGASPDPVSRLIQVLAEERRDFTSIEIAETLWLALQMEPAAKVVVKEPPVSNVSLKTLPTNTLPLLWLLWRTYDCMAGILLMFDLLTPKAPEVGSEIGGEALPDEPVKVTPRASLAAPTPQAGVLPPQTLPVWLADPAMLTDSLAIIRALKPLLRKVNVGVGNRCQMAMDEPRSTMRIMS
ncbi:MAG: hypothetical protein AAFN08_10425, partial [Cyanobacteria bacterium J06559_3]